MYLYFRQIGFHRCSNQIIENLVPNDLLPRYLYAVTPMSAEGTMWFDVAMTWTISCNLSLPASAFFHFFGFGMKRVFHLVQQESSKIRQKCMPSLLASATISPVSL